MADMTTPHDDSDWTTADTLPAPASVPPPRDAVGVFRIEAPGESAQRFTSLADAMSENPRDPEAEIRGIGGCLAQSAPDDQPPGWILTGLGEERLRRERAAARAA